MGINGLEWVGVGWSVLEWFGVGWSGLEWAGVAQCYDSYWKRMLTNETFNDFHRSISEKRAFKIWANI